jgi:hypothetical protein
MACHVSSLGRRRGARRCCTLSHALVAWLRGTATLLATALLDLIWSLRHAARLRAACGALCPQILAAASCSVRHDSDAACLLPMPLGRQVLLTASIAARDGCTGQLVAISDWCGAVQEDEKQSKSVP